VYTHVLVAEKNLGRFLKPEEVVHHIDEDKYNNSPNNIIVFKTHADHVAFHGGREAVQDGDVWWCPDKGSGTVCPLCGGVKDDKATKCIKCRRIADKEKHESRVIKMLSKSSAYSSCEDVLEKPKIARDILKRRIRNESFLSIGREFGVSDNTIKQWCGKYDLPKLSGVIKLIPDEEWESEEISEFTVEKINRYYRKKNAPNGEIIDAYFCNPRITTIAEEFYRDVSAIKCILNEYNIRILSAAESANIKIIEQYDEHNKMIGTFLTVSDVANWILSNGYNGSNNKAKKIRYLISKVLDTGIKKFGFIWKTNSTITNYKDYLQNYDIDNMKLSNVS
jgi:hypothetical protein